MKPNHVCTFKTIYDILNPSTEIKVFRLNDDALLYQGDLTGFKANYNNLAVAYNGVYNNRTYGTIDIEVWDLSILEDPDL